MFKSIIISSLLIVSVFGDGKLSIVQHPSSLSFKGHDTVKESILKEVFSACLGFSTQKYSNWNGLFIEDPFNLPEAVVTVAVDGVSDTGYAKAHHYPLRTDEDEEDVYSSLRNRLSERYPEGENRLVRIDLSNGLQEVEKHDFLKNLKIASKGHKKHSQQYLKHDVEEHREFLKEIDLLNAISEKIERDIKSDNIPDVYWFKISTLHPLVDLYGENSTQVKEAKQLLNDAVIRLNKAFHKSYDGSVLVSLISSDATHTRRSRSILQAADDKENKYTKYNLARDYDKDYPVIFNIILWFGVAMVFTLLAICLAIGSMDPGRDSIIYRMTSTRMKKDN